MYAPILFTLVAASFYGALAEDDEAATMAQIKPYSEGLQALEPKFLAEATEQARQQFAAIAADRSLTLSQIDEKLSKWAAEQGEQIQSQFEDANKKLRSVFAEMKKAIADSSLSNAAKGAFAKIDDITADRNQTAEERTQQIKAIMSSLPEDVRNEMNEFMKSTVSDLLDNIKNEVH